MKGWHVKVDSFVNVINNTSVGLLAEAIIRW